MIERIDHYLGMICGKPLDLVRSATGIDNFFWTYTLLIGNIALIFYSVTAITDAALRLMAICMIGMSFMQIGFTSSIKRATRRGDSVLPSSPLTNESARYWHVYNAFITMFTLIGPFPLFIAIGWACNLIAMYWAIDIQPPRKSWARRAIDWLKAHRPRLAPIHPPVFPVPG